MKRYSVVWDPVFAEQYIDSWVAGDSATRESLTNAANWVDSNLAIDPDRKGQLQPEGVRTVVVPSNAARITATYRIDAKDLVVVIIRMTYRPVR